VVCEKPRRRATLHSTSASKDRTYLVWAGEVQTFSAHRVDHFSLHLCLLYDLGSLCSLSKKRVHHHCCMRSVSTNFCIVHVYHLTSYSSWAVACWAPFAFLGVEINRLNQENPSYSQVGRSSMEMTSPTHVNNSSLEEGSSSSSSGASSGAYLGIMNLYTTLPQFVGTFISWAVFSLLEPGKSPELAKEAHPDEQHSTDGPNAIAVCLFIGACSASVAAWATRRLKRIQNQR
jgi:hypothetical protein